MSTDNTGQVPTPPVTPENNPAVPAPKTEVTAAIPVAPWAPDPTLAGAVPVPPAAPAQPGQQTWPPQGYSPQGYAPQGYPQQPYPAQPPYSPQPQNPSAMSQFIQGEAFAGFRNVKNTKFGSEGFWPNLLRIIGWGYAAVTILDVLISLFSGVIYSPAGVLRNLLSGLVDAVLWLTICMVIANIADDIDATRKNSDQARENAAANTPKSAG